MKGAHIVPPETSYRLGLVSKYIQSGIDSAKKSVRERIEQQADSLLEEPINKLEEIDPNKHLRISKGYFLSCASLNGTNREEKNLFTLIGVRENTLLSSEAIDKAIDAIANGERQDATKVYHYAPLTKTELMRRMKEEFTATDKKALRGQMSDFDAVADYVRLHKKRLKRSFSALNAYDTATSTYVKAISPKQLPMFKSGEYKYDNINDAIELYINTQNDKARDYLSDFIHVREKLLNEEISISEFIFHANNMSKDIEDLTLEARETYRALFLQGEASEEIEAFYSLIKTSALVPKEGVELDENSGKRIVDKKALTKVAREMIENISRDKQISEQEAQALSGISFETHYSVVIESPQDDFRKVEQQMKRLTRMYKFAQSSSDQSVDKGVELDSLAPKVPEF